jgi:sulfhydrogenase subunit beta (sulfur reductase)
MFIQKKDANLPLNLYTFEKKNLNRFLESLMKNAPGKKAPEVYIPIKRDITRFERADKTKLQPLSFEENAFFPIKEHFFAKQENIFNFKDNKIKPTIPAAQPKVFFGLRRCDLAAITHQDKAFLEGIAKDPYYEARRKETTLIGYHCPKAPSQYCFCGSLNLEVKFDLMFYETENQDGNRDVFAVEIGSEKGLQIIKKHANLFQPTSTSADKIDTFIPGSDRLTTLDINPLYDNPDWKKGVDLCLSCGACTTLCPTCYCFEFKDNVKASNPKEGQRVREWSSCQLPDFTRVAGGHIFREKREARFKHRIYHQLEYFKEKMNTTLCTGCGRCIEGCPTRIDFVDIINKMKKK